MGCEEGCPSKLDRGLWRGTAPEREKFDVFLWKRRDLVPVSVPTKFVHI